MPQSEHRLSDQTILEFIRRLDGMFVHLLSPTELDMFNLACSRRLAARDFGHDAGFFLGLSKVKVFW